MFNVRKFQMHDIVYIIIGIAIGYIIRWQDERLRKLEKKINKK